MKQRTSEWLETPKLDYHARQLAEVYRSTVHFCDWLEKIGYIQPDSQMAILDLACGQGGNLAYMGKRYPRCKFIGVDLNPDFVRIGNEILRHRGIKNACIMQGNWFAIGENCVSVFDGVVSFQTLSWLPEFQEPLKQICRLRPKWMALTSLFHDGLVSTTTDTQTYDENMNPVRNMFYNVYSLPVVEHFMKKHGYGRFQSVPFDIDIDLPNTKEFRAHTETLKDGRRILISGPVLEPYYFIAAEAIQCQPQAI